MTSIFESKDGQFCYTPIPKNASSFGHHVFKELLDFEEIKLGNQLHTEESAWKSDKNKHHIVILREPLDRWFSGVAQFLFETRKELYDRDANLINCVHDDFILDPLHLKILFTRLSFDTHTMTQVEYIHHNFPDVLSFKTTFFYIKNSDEYLDKLEFKINIEHFIFSNLGIQINANPIHTAKEQKFKINIKNQLEFCYKNNPIYKNNLDEYLKQDYDLLKSVRLYQGIRISAGQ